jgi:hypothetical protein
MIGRRYLLSITAATALSGAARADGTNLFDLNKSEVMRAEIREKLGVSRSPVEPSRVPAAATRAALAAVPGLTIEEAALLRLCSPFSLFRPWNEYQFKGRDDAGQLVWVRTKPNGGSPLVTRVVPLASVPEKDRAEGTKYAAKHGYTLTSALVVTLAKPSLVRVRMHTYYMLRGVSEQRPGVEDYVWLCGHDGVRMRDLDDMLVKEMGLEGD